MGLTICAFICGITAAGSLDSDQRQTQTSHVALCCIAADLPAKIKKNQIVCACAGTIVFVAVLLLVTKKQQHFSWVLTHYEVDLRAFVPQS